jgi:hypothetical protein
MDEGTKIAVLCLYGMIRNQSKINQYHCLESIDRVYGPKVRRAVQSRLMD